MDRDTRWDRVQLAYDNLTLGNGIKEQDPVAAVRAAYERGESDEFVEPIVIVNSEAAPIGTIKDGDSCIFFNFRSDRAREITRALTFDDFTQFARSKHLRLARYVCMTQYDKSFGAPIAFQPQSLNNILGEFLANRQLAQFRTAETEKYAHVTFFFNCGREAPFPGEERRLVASPRDVATYDLKPEMSAFDVADGLITAINSGNQTFLLVNFANPDMVGHTGNLSAAIRAVETVDECVRKILIACEQAGCSAVITADHGNCEMMIDPETGQPHTAHTLNPAPLYLVDPVFSSARLQSGKLCDVAPTILQLMNFAKPDEMSGTSLILPS